MKFLFIYQQIPSSWTHGSHQRMHGALLALLERGVECFYVAPPGLTEESATFRAGLGPLAQEVGYVRVAAPSLFTRVRALASWRSELSLRFEGSAIEFLPDKPTMFDAVVWDGLGPATSRAQVDADVHLSWLQDCSVLYWIRKFQASDGFWTRLHCLHSVAMSLNDERQLRPTDGLLAIADSDAKFFAATAKYPVYITGHGLAAHVQKMKPWMSSRHSKTAVFFGNLSYGPNEDAARWLARKVWPRVRSAEPEGRLIICGRLPSAAVRQLSRLSGIEVIADPPSIREIVGSSWCSVAPLRFGAGVQNKVVESVYLGTPCIASPVALAGLPSWKQNTLLSECPVEPARWELSILEQWSRPPANSEEICAAREWVKQTLSWDTVAERLITIVVEHQKMSSAVRGVAQVKIIG